MMNSELQVVFIYDTLSCRKEEDDPKEAILYFYPADVSEDKKIAVCGQLMGITHFLIDTFSTPQILSLENIKFSLRKFGTQYVMALGCSSKTPDWLLDKKADILYSLTRFFHRGIQNILAEAEGDRSLLSKKLTDIMEYYIPVSQQQEDLFALTFGILPVISFPKSSASVSVQATTMLHHCMTNTGVLGGIIMHHNKAVGVDLCQDVAQKLAFIQPHQLPPAEYAQVNFEVPEDVNIFIVYVSQRDMALIRRRASTFQQPIVYGSGNSLGSSEIGSTVDHKQLENTSDVSSSQGFSDGSSFFEEASNPALSVASSASSSSENATQHCRVTQLQQCSTMESPTDTIIKSQVTSSPSNEINKLFSEFHRSHSQPILSEISKQNGTGYSSSLPHFSCRLNCDRNGLEEAVSATSLPLEHQLPSSINNLNLVSLAPKSDSLQKVFPQSRQTMNTNGSSNSSSPLSSLEYNDCRHNVTVQGSEMHQEWEQLNVLNNLTESTSSDSDQPQNSRRQLNDGVSSNSTSKASPKHYRTMSNNSKTGPDIDISSVMHMRMMNSFRKLSSHEDLSSCQSSSENERTYVPLKRYINNMYSFQKDNTSGNRSRSSGNSKSGEETYEKANLIIFARGNMRLLLLIDCNHPLNFSVVHSLYDFASTKLQELEVSISNTEEEIPEGVNIDPYCYLKYEPMWKSLAHSGKSHTMNFDVVQLMHKNFTSYPNMNELIIREDDHVVYGYQCVGSEVYYQQSAGIFSGLPLPTDLMGKVPIKAKRRLERDHKIILL